MTNQTLITFITWLAIVLQVLIVLRAIMSWIRPNPRGSIGRFLLEVTEPILWPFQRILPPMAGLDFSPILALVTIQIIENLVVNWLSR